MSTPMKYFVLSVLVFTACCTTPTSAVSPVPTKGKPTAPVEVNAVLSEKSARLTLKFESEAKDVKVFVSGVDGLVVQGEGALVTDGVFARGETKTFDVAFTPGAGRSALVVSVSGSFNGAARARVASFTVGTGPLPQNGEVITTDDGERVKVMPAAPQ
jgi:hypothetical protein